MAYCETLDIVQRLETYQVEIGASTIPDYSTVDKWIAESSARIDQALAKAGYTLPITGENDAVLLRGIVANKVALQVLYAVLGWNAVPEAAREEWGGFRDFIAALSNGEETLIDQSPNSASAGYISIGSVLLTGAYYEENEDTDD